MDTLNLEKFNKETLSTKEELELFRFFNGQKKTFTHPHSNYSLGNRKSDFQKNVIITREKAIAFVYHRKDLFKEFNSEV